MRGQLSLRQRFRDSGRQTLFRFTVTNDGNAIPFAA
jgi:hypothetical protein